MAPNNPTTRNVLPDELLRAASRGWQLFPVRARAKTPLVKEWRKVATNDVAQLAAWARAFSGCNWGMATGSTSDVAVIDIDGPEGRASSAELERQGLTFPSTLVAITGRLDGGEHRYYRMPLGRDIRNDQSGKIAPHIDLRGNGGYVVCPPSLHESGKQYSFIDPDVPLANLPDWLVDRLTLSPRIPPPAGCERKQTIDQGGRTNLLVSLAGTMNKRGMSLEAIEAALLTENAARCKPPLEEAKVRRIAADIMNRYPAGDDKRAAEFADDSLALVFTELHGSNLRFTAHWGRWSIWDGRCWRIDKTLYVVDLAREVCRKTASRVENPQAARRIASAQSVAAIERLARSDRRHAATIDQWDVNPWLLNTPAGVVDLRTGRLRAAEREDYMTKITAVGPSGDCPLWRSFLSRITNGDENLQCFLQRMCGYALTGVTSENALFFLYGTGANGKSVFLNTITGVMGDYARTAPMETFIASKTEHHPTDLAGLQGARLVTAAEIDDGRRWAESKLKSLTGGDRITARFMRQDYFEYSPQFKIMIAGNHKPSLRSVDEAMRRRFNLLPFTVTVPSAERDPQLTKKLREEWAGILQWMIEGCLLWQSGGLQIPKAVSAATADYLAAEDVLSQWFEDRCDLDGKTWTSSAALYGDWLDWCQKKQEESGSQKRFAESLASHGIKPKPTKHARGFFGIRLVTRMT